MGKYLPSKDGYRRTLTLQHLHEAKDLIGRRLDRAGEGSG